MTNAWIDWYLTFITHVNINSIVMWLILQNNAVWDCFKTLTSREILRTQNLLRVEHCAFSEAIRLFQSVGCVRKKLQLHTVQQNQKSLLSLDWDWTEFSLSICRFWLFLSLETIQTPDRSGQPVVKGDTDHGPNKRSQWMMNLLSKIDCVPSNPIFASRSFVVCVWGQRSSDQDDYQRKESYNETCFQDAQSCGWLVIRSNQLGPTIHIKYIDNKPICRHANQRKFHTWWMESSSVFVQN